MSFWNHLISRFISFCLHQNISSTQNCCIRIIIIVWRCVEGVTVLDVDCFFLTLNHVIITCPEPVRILAVTDMRTLEQISWKQRQDDEDSLICYHQQTVQRSAEKNIWSQWWIKCNVLALAFKVGRQCIIIGASSLAMKLSSLFCSGCCEIMIS